MSMKPVLITETALRDGHQSLIATRLTTAEILPILEKMDQAGYYALEVWGGATFDACLRFLNEDPWERLREIRKRVVNTKLQMLLRGQNLLGYKHYADDVVIAFIQKSIENGIDIIRVFDALNDLRNLETSIKAIQDAGGHCQCAISYTTSPVHNIPYYTELAQQMVQKGAHSLCIKDMAGILTPQGAFDLVTALKAAVDVPIEIHTHCTSGIATMTYMKAVEAGVDIIDTAISPFSEGTSQPATESMAVILNESPRPCALNQVLLSDIAEYFKPIKEKYRSNGILNPKVMDVEPNTLTYQVPGGMLSNLLSQLEAQKASHHYEAVLKEIPQVRKDLGYPPLVTPLSQMVGTQAVFNILTGERYKMVPNEIKEYVKGQYGLSPAPMAAQVVSKILGLPDSVQSLEQAKDNGVIITVRPADLIPSELETGRKDIGALAKSEEDVLSYLMFPAVARQFFENRDVHTITATYI